ncbi:MAG TPA: putative sugar O-methyltransferase [Nitrospirae bacterium]|nr:putative sugar O-methyltransferase [Nitrospirota bacterium]
MAAKQHPMLNNNLAQQIENARAGRPFHNYLDCRKYVLEMIEEAGKTRESQSDYWEEELDAFKYMFDASPLIIEKLREHCYHITGLLSYEYKGDRGSHRGKKNKIKNKYNALRQEDSIGREVREPLLLGGYGYYMDGGLVNLDTLKYYESLIALDKSGLLNGYENKSSKRNVVLEIGAGWGGFAYQFKTFFPNTCYIIIDLPQTMLFSYTYLKSAFPEASTFIYGEKSIDELIEDLLEYDLVFLPHHFLKEEWVSKVDLAINMVSFQEMTTGQVDNYIRILSEAGCKNVYSHNRDISPYNNQLSSVSEIMAKHYDVHEIKVLDVDYPQLDIPAGVKSDSILGILKSSAKKIVGRDPNLNKPFRYKHLIGA